MRPSSHYIKTAALMIAACFLSGLVAGCAGGLSTSSQAAAQSGTGTGSGCGKTRFYTIGTGDVGGLYYPTGNAISKVINKRRSELCVRLSASATLGSVFNINEIMKGKMDFGIVQSDRQYQAYNGLMDWEKSGPLKKLRSICSIHPESVTLVAAVDSGIRTVHDLKGKHVNIGNPGSGQRQNAIDALQASGIDYTKDIFAVNEEASKAIRLLQNRTIDAFFYTVGHPCGAIMEAVSGKRKVRFISLIEVDQLLKERPYYVRTSLPYKFYPAAAVFSDVQSFGVKGTFVTSADMPEQDAYNITRTLFEDFEDFKKMHPAYGQLARKDLLIGLTAPVHPGAMKYYQESDLVPLDAPCPPFCR